MKSPKIFVCLPVLEEYENLPQLTNYLQKQTYSNFELIACVNQPEEWWNDREKIASCMNNKNSLDFLNNIDAFPVHIIDKSSKGNGWQGKQAGVGWARKTAMDYALTQSQCEEDILLSIDADTEYTPNYFQSIVDNFKSHPQIAGLSNPYYHRLTSNSKANNAILRYEIYMRNYAINMLLIDNPYQFTALGSAMATQTKTYKKVGGLSPKSSGEDFYFLQKLQKFGNIQNWNSEKVYPAARFSNRVHFGTGPAMIKGDSGDWSSYPIYHFQNFQEIQQTYLAFPSLFTEEKPTPMSRFLKQQLKRDELWQPLRKNYKTRDSFIKACSQLVDGLRILQFLKHKNNPSEEVQIKNLNENLHYFKNHRLANKQSTMFKYQLNAFDNTQQMNDLRNELAIFEYSLRQLKAKD